MSLAASDLALLSRLYDEVADLEPEAARERLAHLPPEQAHLRAALDHMLFDCRDLADDETLATRGEAASTAFLAGGPRLPAAGPAVRAGDTVGPYTLLRPLGHGGMGAVWLAERSDGTLKRQVALKLPRLAWDLHLAERMARERDIASRLEHPNIARLYDAGVDAQGRPYLALAYIDGQAIDDWCAARHCTLRQRLELFLQVVRAVAHAHGRLVVHRDIKPSNVLVDGEGRVHLLDFGIAKLLESAAGHDGAGAADDGLTREYGRMLTPRFAPPELLRGEAATVACDVYSLGVLLYELLVGAGPEPATGPEAPPVSRRAGDPALRRALKGDLDAIVAQALRHDPARRYATADAMAQDIERHLAGLPVLARPDSLGYRLGKFVQRNRLACGAGLAVVLALAGGVGVALVQQARAREAAERAQVVKSFVLDVFKVNERSTAVSAELRRLPAELLLEHGASLIEQRFARQPALQAELFGVIASIFADMGASELAARYAESQLVALRQLGAPPPARAAATLTWGQALLAQQRLAAAQAKSEEALALVDGDAGPLLPGALLLLAATQRAQGRLEAARATLARADAAIGSASAPSGLAARARLEHARQTDSTRFDEARALYESAIAEALAAEGPRSATAIDARLLLAGQLVLQDQPAQADAIREQALAALREGGTAGTIRAALADADQASTRFMMGRLAYAQAAELIERNRRAVEPFGELVPASVRARLEQNLGSVLALYGDAGRALPLLESSAAVLDPLLEAPRDRLLQASYRGLAAMYAGQHVRADALLRERLALRRSTTSATHPYAAFDVAYVALNLAMMGRGDDAQRFLDEALAAAPPPAAPAAAPLTWRQVIWHARARVALLQGRPADARSALASAYTGFNQLPFDDALLAAEVGCALHEPDALARLARAIDAHDADYTHPAHPELLRLRAVAGLCALDRGERARAQAYARQARAAQAAMPQAGAYFRSPLRQLESRLGGSTA
ncbi:MAG: serine/threonine protein kinase [Burkholderiales bacterium]|nr:serine/threonine protein kinase [Burkholderiales bacterium]